MEKQVEQFSDLIKNINSQNNAKKGLSKKTKI